MDILGLGYLPTYEFTKQHTLSFLEFEEWVAAHYPTGIPQSFIDQCNSLFNRATTKQIIADYK